MERTYENKLKETKELFIGISEIDSFPNHPYHVVNNQDTTELTASIKENGIINPVILRNKADGRYEMISGDSREQIRRFIRLTYLVPELLEFADQGKIKMRPAVEIFYLDEESQRDLVDMIDETEAFPSYDQTIRMRSSK